MAEVHNRRRGLLIDKRFQSKFIALGIVLVVSLAVGAFVVWSVSLSGVPSAAQDGGADPFTRGIVGLLILILLLVIVTILYGLRFSHRIVGPVFAFNRHMNWVREGNYTRDLRLRKGDEFQNLANSFNAMQNALRKRTRVDLESLERCEKLVAELKAAAGSGSVDAQAAGSLVAEMEKVLADLRKRSEGLLAG
ncbi:MAG: HAMP domain-containing protein [Deltaproteobacteria bacterium]|nr:HAMP domain-containing protein [Deltaproteobacteria bacterium]